MRSKFASEIERTRRLEICEGCPRYKRGKIEVLNKCLECGCLIFAKSWLKSAECPLGKWGEKDRVRDYIRR